MIDLTPREWATTYGAREFIESNAPYGRLTRREWLVRHGSWIFLLVVVTAWELLGVLFPVAAKVPTWWNHPTISQEIKRIIGASLPGRALATVLMVGASVTLILHWAWGIPG